ncbi:MAG: rod shape-determining protein MreC [Prevotella sp.]|nr:rod shape-determining protein MreC [Prevotella sp.]MBR1504948.1 rod shape-determining protein MreC [Prevotella sp.]
MNNLLDFLYKHYHWFLFVVLEAFSLALLFRYNSYQGSVWFSTANTVAAHVHEANAEVGKYFTMKEINQQLTRRNFYLERQVTQLRRLYGEATHQTPADVQRQLDSLSRYKLVEAKVVSSELHKRDNLMTIDKGSKDGIEPGMGVACGKGIVGVTYLVSDHYTVVVPVLNVHSSRISCAIRNHGYFGVLRWYGSDAAHAYVEDIPRHARFKRGDWVETNGYSSIFPAGVLVGQIEEVYNSRDGLSFKLKVRLSTDFGRLRDVVVITDKSIAERVRIIQAARDSLKLNVKE